MRSVLITGARAPVAVDLGRAFAAAGLAVHFADSVTPFAARWSRAASGVHRLPPPRTAFAAFADALAALVDRLRPVAVVPTCEEVFYVAAAGAAKGFAVLAPPLDTLRKLHSKIAFAKHARALGIAAPKTWRLESQADIDALPLAIDAQVYKPEYSRFALETLIQPRSIAFIPTHDRPWAAQAFVEGQEVCVWSFARDGRIVAAVAYRPVWRHGQAAAYAFERVECPAALEVAATIAAHDRITGHLSFDVIVTPQGEAVPIECNPRAVSGLHLFDAHPALALAMLGEGDAPEPTAGLRYLAPAMALLGIPHALGELRLGNLARDWGRGRDAIGRPGDRAPAFGALIDAARFTAGALRHRRSPAGETTLDIEWNGEPIG